MKHKNRPQTSKPQRLKKPLLIAAAVLLVGVGGLVYANRNDDAKTAARPTAKQPLTVKAEPPTEQEKQAVEEHKETLVQNNKDGTAAAPTPTAPSGKKQVSVVLVNAGGSTVSGYVSGVVEDGGICTATLTKPGNTPRTGTSTGFADASTTNCPPITVSGGSGWTTVLSYESAAATGASSPRED